MMFTNVVDKQARNNVVMLHRLLYLYTGIIDYEMAQAHPCCYIHWCR